MKLKASASIKQKEFLDSLKDKNSNSSDFKEKHLKNRFETKESQQPKHVENSESISNNESGFLSDESGGSSDHSKEIE